MTNKEIKEKKSGVPVTLSDEIYNISVEMVKVAEELLMPNTNEAQKLTEDAKRLVEISKVLRDL